MTTPVTQTRQQPQQKQQPSDHDLAAAVVAALAAYWSAKALTRALKAPFAAAGVGAAALSAVAALVASWPHETMEGTGPATRWAVRTNLGRRSAFFVAAARRVQAAADAARSRGEDPRDAIIAATAREQRYQAQHVEACTHRMQAASAVDGMAAMHGNLLGWKAVRDPAVTPGCLASDKKNFRASSPPMVEGHPSYPGTVHARCRCLPVPPWPDAPVMR